MKSTHISIQSTEADITNSMANLEILEKHLMEAGLKGGLASIEEFEIMRSVSISKWARMLAELAGHTIDPEQEISTPSVIKQVADVIIMFTTDDEKKNKVPGTDDPLLPAS